MATNIIEIYKNKYLSNEEKKEKINSIIANSQDHYTLSIELIKTNNNEIIDFCFKLFNHKTKKNFLSILAEDNYLETLKIIEKNNPDLNTVLYKHALISAAEFGNFEIVKHLLKYSSINTNSRGLIKSCMLGNLEIFELLLPVSDPTFDDMICLYETLTSNKKESKQILKKLIPYCKEKDIYNICQHCIKNNDHSTLNIIYDKLINRKLNNEICFKAAISGNEEIFEKLLQISDIEEIKNKIEKLNNSDNYFKNKYIIIKKVKQNIINIVDNYILKNKINAELDDNNKEYKEKNKRKI